MSDKKPCLRCERAIDPYAKICPYCNWDQSQTNPPAIVAGSEGGVTYVPPAERNWRRMALTVGGFILLLVASFGIGAWINSDGAPEEAPEPVNASQTAPVAPTKRSDMTLVPVEPGDAFEQPITSAPLATVAEGQPAEYQRSDATAVSSVEYTQLAQRAQAEKKANVVDPRSIRGPAYTPAPAAPRMQPRPPEPDIDRTPMTSASSGADSPEVPRERARVVVSTRPVPQYQPIPDLQVTERVTARLELMIGADGRVKEVNLKNSIPGQTPKLIAAVQSWRFKPATENGVPVAAPFSVDISFGANE